MTAKDIIESGMLEAYAMGSLTDAERIQVEEAIARYPEVKAELDAVEDSLNSYAAKHAVAPPRELREKVLARIGNEDSGKADEVVNITWDKDRQADIRYRMVWSIAASVLLLFSLTINIVLYNKSTLAEKNANDLTQANRELNNKAHNLDSTMRDMTASIERYKNDMAILMDPMYKMVELKGMKVSPEAKAMVCWCPGSKLVYFENEKMPPPPTGMQYQLWAIVDGKPVDAGMITMGAGLHKMKDVVNATAFAVTLEKEGGSDTPHGDMYVLGNI